MTTGVRLTRMPRNRGRNLYAQYGEPWKPMSISESLAAGNMTESGSLNYSIFQLGSAVVGFAGGGGNSALSNQVSSTVLLDMTPLGALFGSLFGVKSTFKPVGKQYTEFQLFQSKYGIPINEGDGNIRLAGNVIWTTNPKERTIRMEQKAGDSPDTFFEYKSRSGQTSQEIFDNGYDYDPQYSAYFTYIEYHYTLSFAVAFANIKTYGGQIVRIWADKEVVWDIRENNLNKPVQLMYVGLRNSLFHSFYKDTVISVYDGTQTDVDPTIFADKGINTPTYENTCYAVFKNLDLNDFGGKIPIIEAEVAFRPTPVKFVEYLQYGPYGEAASNSDIGWVHDTTDGYIQGTGGLSKTSYYYDLDIYDCISYRSPKIYHGAFPYTHESSSLRIHEIKYGFICYQDKFDSKVVYIDRRSSEVVSVKDMSGTVPAFPTPKQVVYNYFIQFSELTQLAERRALYAVGEFGIALAQSWMFSEWLQDHGWIVPDGEVAGDPNPVKTTGFNNRAGGLLTPGTIGGIILDRSGRYRITSDSGSFGTHGSPTYLWNTEFTGQLLDTTSPMYSLQTQIPFTGGAGIVTLLEDMGTLEGQDPELNNGLLLIQVGGYLHHYNTNFNGLFYTGLTKSSSSTFNIQQLASFELPMCGLLPDTDIFGYGGIYRMINCAELKHTGTNWRTFPFGSVPIYQNPNNDYIAYPPPANSNVHWFTATWMSATHYGGETLFLCKHRYAAANPTLAEVVTEIIISKIPYIHTSDLDVSTLTDIVRGYMMADTSDLREFIERLRKGYFFDVTESNGKLKFIKRGIVETPIEIEETLLVDPTKVIVQSVLDLAKEGVLNYADIDFDYLQATQRHRREQSKSLSLLENTLPIAFDKDEAARVAYIYIAGSYAEYTEVQATIDRRYTYLDCGDIISLGQFNRLRINNMVYMQDGSIQIQAVTEDANVYNTDIDGVAILGYESSTNILGTKIKSFSFEVPYLEYQEDDSIGYVYFIAYKRFSTDPISISVSYNDSNSFRYVGSCDPSKFIGRITNMLSPPNYSIKHGSWDYTNYVDMYLQYGNPPVSCTKEEVYLGANRILVGKEVLNFTTVTQLGVNKYRLSGLLRGRDGTEIYTRLHASGEYVLELYNTIPRLPIIEADIGKAVLIHTSNGYRTEIQDAHTIRGVSFWPLAPANISAAYSGNDIVISWKRRNSAQGELIPYENIPQGTVSSYSVDILNNNMSVKRTITSASTTVTYTEAQQLSDWGSVQEQVSLMAYQHTDTIIGFGGYANINLVNSKYYTDFSNETIGIQPTDLTIVSGSYVSALPVLDNGVKVLELYTGTIASENSIIKINTIPLIADGDIRIKFSYDTFYGYEEAYLLKIYLKGSKTFVGIQSSGLVTCYMEGLLVNQTSVDYETYNLSPLSKNTIYNIRVQYYEESIQVKIWDTVEPSTWQVFYFPEVIGSHPNFLFDIAGYAGIGSYSKAIKLHIRDIEINDLYY